MKRLSCIITYLLFVSFAYGGDLWTVEPSEARPGMPATVTGGNLPPELRIMLGGVEISPDLRTRNLLIFTVPPLPPGEYLLELKDIETEYSSPSLMSIVEPTPRIVSISPENVDECALNETVSISIETQEFLPGGNLLLDGKIVPYENDSGRITFKPPPLSAGTYGIQISNPDGTTSLPHPIWVNNIPEIMSVTVGNDYVNYYEIVITGKNFTYGSQVVISEYPVGFTDLPPFQRAVPLEGGLRPDGSEFETTKMTGRRESMRYIDCRTLVYNRRPYSAQPKEIILQIVNPDGKVSSPYKITLP